MPEHHDIVVIGAGFAGLGAAWQLLAHGLDDFVVFERAGGVGGTWRANRYPGAACDIRSDLYSFSFAPDPGWRHGYGRQPEILDYLERFAARSGIPERLRLGTELERAVWDEGSRTWALSTSAGPMSARVLLSGHGPLIDRHWPAIPGIDGFGGALVHSSAWSGAEAVAGARVAVIGTGASAIQLVPALQSEVERLVVFQRTAPWIIPRHDRPTSARRRALFAAAPLAQRASRSAIFASNELRWFGFAHPRIGAAIERYAEHHLRSQIADPELRARVHPDYRFGCKRVLVSDDYYPALTRPNVDLVTDGIERVEAHAVIAGGVRHPVDVIVCATGFDATRPAIAARIVGSDGASLADVWRDGMYALRGASVPGFPNLFLLHGPNAQLAHNSAVGMIECQIGYAVQAIEAAGPGGVLEALPAATARYNTWLDRHLARAVWSRGGCTSFYLDAGGRNTVLWPLRASSFRRAVRRFDPEEYLIGGPYPDHAAHDRVAQTRTP